MKSYLALAALLAALVTFALPKMRAAQTRPQSPIAAAATPSATAGASATPEPEFLRPGEVAPPPGSPTPEPEHATRVASSPEQAIRDYVELAGNWTAATVVDHYRQVADRTVGDARVHAQEMVARVPIDPTYQARKPSLESEVAGVVRRGGQNETQTFLVVVRERLTLKGAAKTSEIPAWQIATATIEQTQGGWVLTRWKDPR